MPNSPFRPLDEPGRARSSDSRTVSPGWPPRPEPRADARQRAAQLLARLRNLAEPLARWTAPSAAGSDDVTVDPDSVTRPSDHALGHPSGHPSSHPSNRRFGRAAIAGGIVVAATAGGVATGIAIGSGRVAPPTTKAVPLAGGLPLVVGSTTTNLPGSALTGSPGNPLAGGSGVAAGSSVAAPTTTALLVVHAAGAVARPGVYLLPSNARVDDVLAAAGGPAADADLDAVNLAEGLADGLRIAFPRRGVPVPTITAPTRASAPSVAVVGGASTTIVPVDLNTATPAELDALPGVGPATAAAIIEFRTRNGRFRSVAQLLDVPGIGDAKLSALRSRVRV